MLRSDSVLNLDEIQEEMHRIAVEVDKFCSANGIEYSICAGSLLGAVRHKGFIPWDDDFDIMMERSNFDRFISSWNHPELSLIKIGDPNYIKLSTPAKVHNACYRVEEVGEKANGMPEYNNYGVFVDIFPIDRYPKSLMGKLIHKYVGKLILAKSLSQFHMRNTRFVKRIAIKFSTLLPTSFITFVKNNISAWMARSQYKDFQFFYGYGFETPFDCVMLNHDDLFPLSRKFEINGYKFFGPNRPERYLTQRYGDYMKIPDVKDRKGHIVKVIST
ncbi:MAG: LicD family protein [Idiomarina sp.]|nr:LicD family protein [Idiomarina sp.]